MSRVIGSAGIQGVGLALVAGAPLEWQKLLGVGFWLVGLISLVLRPVERAAVASMGASQGPSSAGRTPTSSAAPQPLAAAAAEPLERTETFRPGPLWTSTPKDVVPRPTATSADATTGEEAETRQSGVSPRRAVVLALEEAVFAGLAREREPFVEFCREARCRIEELMSGRLQGALVGEALLTLARGAAFFQLSPVAEAADAALTNWTKAARAERPAANDAKGERQGESDGQPTAPPRGGELFEPLQAAWMHLEEALAAAGSVDEEERFEVGFGEFEALLDLGRSGASPEELTRKLEELGHEPTRRRFRRLRAYAERLASARGARVEVEIIDDEVRLARARFAGVWLSMILLLDNALSHGLEGSDARRAQGKPEALRVTLASRREGDKIYLEVGDDGPGVNWTRIAEKARAGRLRAATREDLVQALFADVVGERDSGTRGLGLAAVANASRELHGTLSVISSAGRGTKVRIELPLRSNSAMFVPSLHPARTPEAFPRPPVVVLSPERALG